MPEGADRRPKKVFTYDEAARLLPEVRRITDEAYHAVEEISENAPSAEAAQPAVEAVVTRWANDVMNMGIDVKGLWLIDFDNGSGYYCWHYPKRGCSSSTPTRRVSAAAPGSIEWLISWRKRLASASSSSALVVIAGALVTLFAVGALFDALDHPQRSARPHRRAFRRPPRPARMTARTTTTSPTGRAAARRAGSATIFIP
jgi:hypothetical protein